MDAAFDDFTDDDLDHGLGGTHWLIEAEGRVLAHASVVARRIELDGRPLRTGYVEAVAVEPGRQGTGLGTQVMRRATDHIRAYFELGVLGTGEQHFYERLGWERWAGRSFVREVGGAVTAPAPADPWLMVLRTGPSAGLPLSGTLTCEWRPGDAW